LKPIFKVLVTEKTIMTLSTSKLVKENLSKWDEQSPLTDDQIKSVMMLNHLNEFDFNEPDSSGNEINLDKEDCTQTLAHDNVLKDVSSNNF
jgi:hypothetical protein